MLCSNIIKVSFDSSDYAIFIFVVNPKHINRKLVHKKK